MFHRLHTQPIKPICFDGTTFILFSSDENTGPLPGLSKVSLIDNFECRDRVHLCRFQEMIYLLHFPGSWFRICRFRRRSTFNRRNMFPIAIRNFYEFKYPPEKLQWVIVEDSTNGETVKDLLPPNDKRIKYIYLDVSYIPYNNTTYRIMI